MSTWFTSRISRREVRHDLAVEHGITKSPDRTPRGYCSGRPDTIVHPRVQMARVLMGCGELMIPVRRSHLSSRPTLPTSDTCTLHMVRKVFKTKVVDRDPKLSIKALLLSFPPCVPTLPIWPLATEYLAQRGRDLVRKHVRMESVCALNYTNQCRLDLPHPKESTPKRPDVMK
jgi:hypothetical protein